MRVQVARSPSPVPAFERARTRDARGARVDVDDAEPDHFHEPGKTVQAVRRDAIPTGIREKPGAELSPALREAGVDEDA